MYTKRLIHFALQTAFYASAMTLLGCDRQPAPPASAAATTGSAPSAPVAEQTAATPTSSYTPPTAEQLYQLVAPIALFPDNLVAQVLAGSTHPDQISAAQNVLSQNPTLKGTLLQAAVDPQPWDASVKGLTTFPSVLRQMSRNIPWTTALGTAYANDPVDVINAIQVMRQRAAQHGNLKNTPQQRVVMQTVTTTTTTSAAGPSVIPASGQVIQIDPASDDTVYVPSYDPQTAYGEEVPLYPSYAYEQGYSGEDLATFGAVSFGTGVLIGGLLEHNHYDRGPAWGWHNWGMHWSGGPYRGGPGPGRPGVTYQNSTYMARNNFAGDRGEHPGPIARPGGFGTPVGSAYSPGAPQATDPGQHRPEHPFDRPEMAHASQGPEATRRPMSPADFSGAGRNAPFRASNTGNAPWQQHPGHDAGRAAPAMHEQAPDADPARAAREASEQPRMLPNVPHYQPAARPSSTSAERMRPAAPQQQARPDFHGQFHEAARAMPEQHPQAPREMPHPAEHQPPHEEAHASEHHAAPAPNEDHGHRRDGH